ncbi:MAG: GGDEF domain-containing response regulator [Thermodesulfobacteriota bacterium]
MPHKILVVDDEVHIRETLEKSLTMMGYTCRTAKDGEEALERLASEFFDIVIADIRMPRMDGMALLRAMRQEHRDVDVIMMTGFGQEHTYMEVIEAGATDFIAKPFRHEELQAKVKRVSRERTLRAELLYLSLHDSLTGLFNRRFLYQKLQEEVERAKRQKRDLAMIILDVDHFKEYNDLRGHLDGDQLLAGLSQILTSCIRQNVDTVYRYGGDEFAILLIEADISQARSIAERIRRAFEAKHIDRCTLSLGVAQLQPKGNPDDLIRMADEAMYRAKRAGGNRVEEFGLSRDTP